jgi:List-Bact-rpt repeat protein
MRQTNTTRSRFPGVATLLLFSLPVLAQQYNSNDVTPPNSLTGKLNAAATGKQVGVDGNNHAILENGNAANAIDLHPAGYYSSMAISTDDIDQCGSASYFGNSHAVRWSGTAASFVDLHSSSGYTWTTCLGTSGGQQVGFGENPIYTVTIQHAILWINGVATTIHPATLPFNFSKALGIRNGQQVGYVSNASYPYGETLSYHPLSHAVLWTGSAASAVDLNPAGYTASEALATNGTQQGGWAYNSLPLQSQHAALWSGTADSFIDMNPAGYSDSRITALTATQQVGDGWAGPMGAMGSVRHALVWSGTPGSVVDLNQYLPAGYIHAVATGIDANGNVVGYAYNTPTIGTVVPPDAIAVVFAPGAVAPSAVASLTMSPSNPAPGALVTGTVSLGGPAPAAGVTVSFLSGNSTLLPAPPPLMIPAGQTSASFSFIAGGPALQIPTLAKLYVTDGTTSRQNSIVITPVVVLDAVSVNPVEGGFATTGTVNVSIPAQGIGATVALSSSSTLVTLPASVTVPAGSMNASFSATTSPVTAATTVPVSASFNGVTVAGSVTLSPAPVVAVASLNLPLTQVGGQPVTGTVTVTNYPRNVEGVVITLTSGDTRTMSSSTVTIPQFAYSATFTLATTVVTGTKGVSLKASYGASSVTSNISILPIPTITIVQADYFTDTHLFKVAATTTNLSATFTYGTDPLSGPIGTMQFELGQFKAATTMATAPALATVWSSDGGQATMIVTSKLSTAGGGGGGGSTTYKISTSTNGKGTITSSPAAASYAAGTVVTLTATPAAGSPWIGWSGACSGIATTCTLTMNQNYQVVANFR